MSKYFWLSQTKLIPSLKIKIPKSQDNFDKNFDEIKNLISQSESYIRLAFDKNEIATLEKAEEELFKAKQLSEIYSVNLKSGKNRNGVEQYKKIGIMLNNVAEKKSYLFKKKDELKTTINESIKVKPKPSSCNRFIKWMFGSPS